MDGDDDRERRFLDRAEALTDEGAWRDAHYHLRCIHLLSRMVPEGVDFSDAAVRTERRRVIVHRDLRAATTQCILRDGWDQAVTRIPPGAKSNEFEMLSGWSWHHPELPGTPVRPSHPLIRDVAMLKGKHEFKGQDKRRATLTGARLNEQVVRLAVSPDASPKPKRMVRAYTRPPSFHLEPSGATWKPLDIDPPQLTGQAWLVGTDPDVAAQIKLENYKCDAIARNLLKPTETQRERMARLNAGHRALLESIVGVSTYVPRPTKSHPAADMSLQTAAMDMVFTEEAGFSVWERRDRHNDLLESTEKLTSKGRRYRPGRASPGKRLTGESLIAAIATLSPEKRGWPYSKPYPRGTETGMFDKARRAGRKSPMDYVARAGLFEDDEMCRQWDRIKTSSAAGYADRNRLKPLIDVPEGWSRNSFAEELMSLRSKKTEQEWGGLLFDQVFYSDRSLNAPGLLMRRPVTEKEIPLHEAYAREPQIVIGL